jgi:hypothetical protein
VLLAVAMAFTGFEAASKLAPREPATAAFVTERVVTRTTENGVPNLVTELRTVTQPGETSLLTVQRDGRTVVIRSPAETSTVRGATGEHVVTDRRTSTVVRTETADRVATVTTPGRTDTVTTEVTQPQRTVTDTVTNQVTVTNTVTVTTEVTTTETVTEPRGK